MATLSPYLNFNGNTFEVFNFYKSVFGGEFETVMRFKDAPPQTKISEADADKIMHMALPIGPDSLLMGSDVSEAYGQPTVGNNFYISICPQNQNDATNIFNDLAAGGQVMMPFEPVFWGGYFGMLKDKYGVQWMMNFRPPQ